MSLNCEICGQRKATYVCQKCGRKVCGECVNPTNLVCVNCEKIYVAETYPSIGLGLFPKLLMLGLTIIFAGFGLILASTIMGGVPTSTGGFIWIFPLPPIFVGSGFGEPITWIIFTFMVLFLGFFLFSLLKIFKS